MKLFFDLLRGKQWVKNIFLLFPLIFSDFILNGHYGLIVCGVFLLFA